MTRVRRTLGVVVAIAMFGATLSACGSRSGPSSVTVGHGVTVVVPAGANFTPRATASPQTVWSLLAPVELSHPKNGPSPFASLVTPVHLRWTGTFPKSGVELHFHVKVSKVPVGVTPFVATYDPATKIWHPVASTYDATTGVVSAHADHFSIWGVFDVAKTAMTALVKDIVSSLFGSIKVNVPAPNCADSIGLTAVASPADGILDVCAQNNGDTSVTLKIRSHLAFPVDVIPPAGTVISVNPAGGIFEQIGGYLNKAGTGQSTRTLVAAGSEADLTFPLTTNHYVVVRSDLDTEAYLASIIDSGVSLLTVMSARLGGNPKAVLGAIAQGACAALVAQIVKSTPNVSLSNIAALTKVAVACASSVVDLGVSGVVQGIVATVSGLIENVLQTGFLGAMIIVGGVSGATSTVTVSKIAVKSTPLTCPLLGSRNFHIDDAGFGTCRPVSFSNGGDPSGTVSSITWESWGAPSVLGFGENPIFMPGGGYYPQPVRAELRATDLGHCPGSKSSTYLQLFVREPNRPGGPDGPWFSWSGARSLC
jgi:hypothetical protein